MVELHFNRMLATGIMQQNLYEITMSCQNQPLVAQNKMSFISMTFCQVSVVQLKALTGLNKNNKTSSKKKTLYKRDYKQEEKHEVPL